MDQNFDSRIQWPGCVHAIRNQENCGSCWAFASTEVLSDRFCIKSRGDIDVVLAPEDMLSCNSASMDCKTGYLAAAWDYLKSNGAVNDSCFPY